MIVLSTLLLAAQLQIATPDSVYASSVLRSLIDRAAVANRAPPGGFPGYRASVESEFALVLRDTLGRERSGQVEQIASEVEWRAGTSYEMHVVGYRQQSLGAAFSSLSVLRGWTVPSLYGDRLFLGVQLAGDSGATSRRGGTPRDSVVAVHPLAPDRERFYRYAGGDTVAIMRSGARAIHIVRVRVTPHLRDSTRLSAMSGEIYLDVERAQIVRMRGRFVVLNEAPRRPLAARVMGLVGVAYAEFVNTEVNGQVWLPETQRTELQSSIAMLGGTRAVLRVLSRFSGYATGADAAARPPLSSDTMPLLGRRTTWAPSDSVSRYDGWRVGLGEATAAVSADDFDDLAPDSWRSTGASRLAFAPTKTDNVVRYDRVEGLYTGLEANLRLRSLVPGLSVGAHAGWAWTERTARGDVHASYATGGRTVGARVARLLATTNDFPFPDAPESGGVSALLNGVDDHDYVDRRRATLSAGTALGSLRQGIIGVQLGVAEDASEVARLQHGLMGSGTFRPNRGVRDGSYVLGIVEAELHPDLAGASVQPGLGARARLEIAQGGLAWRRAELAMWARTYRGRMSLGLDAQGGALLGSRLAPQVLFELGGSGALPGYEYKEFVGDRAALFRGYASYALPRWRAPMRLWRTYTVPGIGPGLALSLQGGWSALGSAAARAAVAELGAGRAGPAIARETGHVRATAGLGLTVFSGLAHVGIARPIDQAAPWKLVAGIGRHF